MTKRDAHTIALLDQITATKNAERTARQLALAEIEGIILERTAQARAATNRAVRGAVEYGISKRQIGLALGTTANATYDARIAEATIGLTAAPAPTDAPVVTLNGNTATLTFTNYSDHDVTIGDAVWTIEIDPQVNTYAVPMQVTGTDDLKNVQRLFTKFVQPMIGPSTDLTEEGDRAW